METFRRQNRRCFWTHQTLWPMPKGLGWILPAHRYILHLCLHTAKSYCKYHPSKMKSLGKRFCCLDCFIFSADPPVCAFICKKQKNWGWISVNQNEKRDLGTKHSYNKFWFHELWLGELSHSRTHTAFALNCKPVNDCIARKSLYFCSWSYKLWLLHAVVLLH